MCVRVCVCVCVCGVIQVVYLKEWKLDLVASREDVSNPPRAFVSLLTVVFDGIPETLATL